MWTPPRAAPHASSPAGSGAGGPEVEDDAASVASFATNVGTRGGAARQKRKVPARKESETDHDRASIIENAMDYVYILEGGNMGNFTYALRRLPEATSNPSVSLIVNRCHDREACALNLRACVMTMSASVRAAECDKLKRVEFSRAVTFCENVCKKSLHETQESADVARIISSWGPAEPFNPRAAKVPRTMCIPPTRRSNNQIFETCSFHPFALGQSH